MRRPSCVVILTSVIFSFMLFLSARYLYNCPPDGEDQVAKIIIDSPYPNGNNIFFVETSCAVNNSRVVGDRGSGVQLSPRAACALESAAQANIRRPVYLLHTCPVRTDALHRTAPHALAALSRQNVRLWPVQFEQVFAGSPMESWLASGKLRESLWPAVHSADVLRFVLLWKYGGTYFDTDMFTIKSLKETRLFGCAESDKLVSIGVMDFPVSDVGRRLVESVLQEIHKEYRPRDWNYNGPKALTRALLRECRTEDVSHISPALCRGFQLLPTSAFYPVHWVYWKQFFFLGEEDAEYIMEHIRELDSVAVHMWNRFSKNVTVHLNSIQPFAQIARRVCPRVVASLNGVM